MIAPYSDSIITELYSFLDDLSREQLALGWADALEAAEENRTSLLIIPKNVLAAPEKKLHLPWEAKQRGIPYVVVNHSEELNEHLKTDSPVDVVGVLKGKELATTYDLLLNKIINQNERDELRVPNYAK
jgi:ribosomal protein L7Ae-like RNA K-turn-binding protein